MDHTTKTSNKHLKTSEDLHEHQVALVTGSTRQNGIGLGIAKCLAKNHGMTVILHGTRDAKCEEVEQCRVDLSREYSVRVHYIQADLSTTDGAESLFHQVDKLYPEGIHVLVNNAGISHDTLLEDIAIKEWETILTTNLTAPFVLIKHFIPAMKKRGWGRIINISSGLGLRAVKASGAYCSSKHGIMGLTKVVGLEAATTGVTCNAICPGFVETEMYYGIAKSRGISLKEAKETMTNPTKKLVTAEQVGETVSFLCSRSAENITTASLSIDGGLCA